MSQIEPMVEPTTEPTVEPTTSPTAEPTTTTACGTAADPCHVALDPVTFDPLWIGLALGLLLLAAILASQMRRP